MDSSSLLVGPALKKAWIATEASSPTVFRFRRTITSLALTLGALPVAAFAQQPHINHPLAVQATPEPSSWIAFAIGGFGLFALARIARVRSASGNSG